MSQQLVFVEVGRNCVHFGVNYGKGRFPVPPQVARAMERSGDLARPLAGAQTTTLDEYDAERLKKDVPPPADLRTGFGLAQFGGGAGGSPATGGGGERTDNTFEPRRPSPFDMGAEGARDSDDREGNFLLTGDEGDDDPAGRAPEAGREDMSGIVAGGGTGGGMGGAGRVSDDELRRRVREINTPPGGGSPDRSGVLIAQSNAPLPAGGGDVDGSQNEGRGVAQTRPGEQTPIQDDAAAGGGAGAGGATGGGSTAAGIEDDPKAEIDAGAPPPKADPTAPLKGDVPPDFPKRKELADAKITRLEQLSTMNREQLIGVKGIGEKTADAIGLRLYEMVEAAKGDGGGGTGGGQ